MDECAGSVVPVHNPVCSFFLGFAESLSPWSQPTHLHQLQAALQAHGGNALQKGWSHFTIPPCFEYSRFTPLFPLSNFLLPVWLVPLGKRSSDLNFFANYVGEIVLFLWENNRAVPKQQPHPVKQHVRTDSMMFLKTVLCIYNFCITNITSHLVPSWPMPWEVFNWSVPSQTCKGIFTIPPNSPRDKVWKTSTFTFTFQLWLWEKKFFKVPCDNDQ